MYPTYNEEKYPVAEKFIRTLKKNFFDNCAKKCLFWCVYFDIIDKYNYMYHNTIKKKPSFVNICSYAVYNIDYHNQDRKF